jgi:hypothetical protein
MNTPKGKLSQLGRKALATIHQHAFRKDGVELITIPVDDYVALCLDRKTLKERRKK